MNSYQCQKCGKMFEAEKPRKFCSKECQGLARANYYLTLDTGQMITLPPPKGGWTIGVKASYPIPAARQTVLVSVDNHGHATHKIQYDK